MILEQWRCELHGSMSKWIFQLNLSCSRVNCIFKCGNITYNQRDEIWLRMLVSDGIRAMWTQFESSRCCVNTIKLESEQGLGGDAPLVWLVIWLQMVRTRLAWVIDLNRAARHWHMQEYSYTAHQKTVMCICCLKLLAFWVTHV